MSKSQINVVSLVRATAGGNNLQITVMDGSRMERTLNLSPQAQEQLLAALTATTPFGSAGQAQIADRVLVARNVRAALMQDNKICLEVLLGNQIALHILLPGLLPDAAIKAIQEVLPDPPEAKH